MFRPQSISATDARKYFSQLINKVQFSSKSFVIKSYRKPTVRIVKEEYIAILEQVLGKKTVSQFLQISGDDNLFEATKIIEIKKIFQRRLSGTPRPERRPERPRAHRGGVEGRPHQGPKQQPQPQPQPQQKPKPQAQQKKQPQAQPQAQAQAQPQPQKPKSPQPQSQAQKPTPPRPKEVPEPRSETPQKSNKGNRVLLLSNGKSYE